jgi:thiol-disulfide isomerase/thioredoxin
VVRATSPKLQVPENLRHTPVSIMQLSNLGIPVPPLIFFVSMVTAVVGGRFVTKRGEHADSSIFTSIYVGLFVARLSFVAHYLPAYRQEWKSIFDFRDLGFDPLPGVVAGLLVLLYVFFRKPHFRRAHGVALIVGTACWFVGTAATVATTADASLPAITLFDTHGKVRQLGDGKRKLTVVNLWASWCGPCRSEMPSLVRAQREMQDIEIDFVNQGESIDSVYAFFAENNIWPSRVLLDARLDVARHMKVRAFPTTLFFDEYGRLLSTHLGPYSRATFQEAVRTVAKSATIDLRSER